MIVQLQEEKTTYKLNDLVMCVSYITNVLVLYTVLYVHETNHA